MGWDERGGFLRGKNPHQMHGVFCLSAREMKNINYIPCEWQVFGHLFLPPFLLNGTFGWCRWRGWGMGGTVATRAAAQEGFQGRREEEEETGSNQTSFFFAFRTREAAAHAAPKKTLSFLWFFTEYIVVLYYECACCLKALFFSCPWAARGRTHIVVEKGEWREKKTILQQQHREVRTLTDSMPFDAITFTEFNGHLSHCFETKVTYYKSCFFGGRFLLAWYLKRDYDYYVICTVGLSISLWLYAIWLWNEISFVARSIVAPCCINQETNCPFVALWTTSLHLKVLKRPKMSFI